MSLVVKEKVSHNFHASYKMYFGPHFYMPVKPQKDAVNSEMILVV